MSKSGGLVLGRYVLGSRLGTGGMGEVYLTTQRGLGGFEKVQVMKLLLPHLNQNPVAVQMFLDEARLAARLKHPNIVETYDVAHEEGRYFITMELVNGVSLSQLLKELARRNQPVASAVVVHVARSLCAALHHAHELKDENQQPLNVVHRDVTPHNVLVSQQGEVKLTDFGIAKMNDSRTETRPGTVRGKFEYVAPERFRGEPADRRADIFSLGVSLYYLATLRSPFRQESERDIMDASVRGDWTPVQQLRPDLPGEICRAIEKALAPAPEHRFATAADFLEELPEVDRGAELLAELVTMACASDLQGLGAGVDRTKAMTSAVRGTQDLAVSGEMAEVSPTATHSITEGLPTVVAKPVVPGAARPARWLTAAGLAMVLGGILVLVWLWPSEPPPPPPPRADSLPSPLPAAALTFPVMDLKPPPPKPSVPPEHVEPDTLPTRILPPRPSASTHKAAPPPVVASTRSVPTRPTKPGFLTVDALPFAEVLVDGKPVGETPLDRIRLPPGKHQIKLVNPTNMRAVERNVNVVTGETAFLKVDLR